MNQIINRWTDEIIAENETTSIRQLVSENKKNLRSANLRDANLRGSNLRGANLRDANLRGSNLRGANLSGADLRSANLRDANLSGSNLSDAGLRGSNLRGANLSGSNLSDAGLRGSNLRGANLSGSNLSDADLRGSNLRGADLSGANLSDADLRGSNLRGADLSGSNLRGADLSGADLSGAGGLLNAADFLVQFEKDELGIIAYKRIGHNTNYPLASHWKIAKGAILTEVANPTRTQECGCGVNFGTLQWCKDNYSDADLWKCRIAWIDLADVCVPYNTDGKARCAKLTLLEIITIEQ